MVLAGLVIALGRDRRRRHRRRREHRAPAPPGTRPPGSTQSTASIILESSLEVRGAVVYASLIEAAGPAADLLPRRASPASFFKPLAFTYALAVLVSLVVAMISTPALSLILFSRAKLAERESAGHGLDAARLRAHAAPDRAPPDPGLRRGRCSSRRRRRRRAPARAVAVPDVQGTGLPDALGHQARDVAPGGATHRHPGAARSCGPSRGSATSARTSAKRCSARRSSASTSARTGSASTRGRLRQDAWPRSRRWSPAIPGCSPTWRPTWRSGSVR